MGASAQQEQYVSHPGVEQAPRVARMIEIRKSGRFQFRLLTLFWCCTARAVAFAAARLAAGPRALGVGLVVIYYAVVIALVARVWRMRAAGETERGPENRRDNQ